MPEQRAQQAEFLVANTWDCNLRCSYCFVDGQELAAGRGQMPAALAQRVVDAVDQALPHVDSICLHLYGGEPLLNLPAIQAMVERAAATPPGRFSFAITTNGTCLSDQAIELLDAGRFRVILSIDGPAAIHDQCRHTAGGAPTHHRVLAFLDALRSRTRCQVRGSAVVRPGWSLRQASRYLHSLPLDTHKAQVVRGQPGHPFELSDGEKAAYLRDLEWIGDQVIQDLEAGRAPRDDRFSGPVLQLLKGVRREVFCDAGGTVFGITPAGEVLPCILMDREESLLGHIVDDPHTWVQAGARWKTARPRRAECDACAAEALCGGGCPAMLPVCGAGECDLTRKNAEVSRAIFEQFRDRPTRLLALAGIS